MDNLTLIGDVVNCDPRGEGRKGPEAAGAPAPARSAPGASPLPCLFKHNVPENREKQARLTANYRAKRHEKSVDGKRTFDKPLLSRDRKAAETLFLNASELLGRGVECCAFVTMTTGDNLSYWTPDGWEAARNRFKAWISHALGFEYVFGKCDWCRVIEPQRRGAIHWHLLIALGVDIRTGVDFDAFNRGDYRSAGCALRGFWSRLRESAERYGFGRCEIMPIKSEKWEAAARYVGKYISKGIRREVFEFECEQKARPLHSRRVGYSAGGWRVANLHFSWLDSGEPYRRAVEWWALSNGIETYEEIKTVFGKRWAWRNKKGIIDGYKNHLENIEKNGEISLPF